MKTTILSALLAAFVAQAHADDFTTSLDSARKAYEQGDIDTAREELNYATQLLGQMRAGKLEEVLPDALPGWERKQSESANNPGLAMLGGGTTANAEYRKDGKSVKIAIVTDSPMIASMGMLFNNPALAGADGRMKRIAGQKAMVKKDGDITAMIDNRIMVTVNGSAASADLEAYFQAIDFKSLKSF